MHRISYIILYKVSDCFISFVIDVFFFIHPFVFFFIIIIHPLASSWKTFYQELNEFLINNAICLIDIKEIWGKLLFPLVQKNVCSDWRFPISTVMEFISIVTKLCCLYYRLVIYYTIPHQNIEITFMYTLKLYFQWKLRISLIFLFKGCGNVGNPCQWRRRPRSGRLLLTWTTQLSGTSLVNRHWNCVFWSNEKTYAC